MIKSKSLSFRYSAALFAVIGYSSSPPVMKSGSISSWFLMFTACCLILGRPMFSSRLATNIGLKQYYKEPFASKGILNKEAFENFGAEMIEKYDIRSGQGNKTQVRSMSGGNQQKAIIAREIELQSPLMIFVQPTRGVDIGAIENIHKMIIAERDKGKAILLISLELDEIMNVADTIGVIYNGQLQKIASRDSLSINEVGEYMMGAKHE